MSGSPDAGYVEDSAQARCGREYAAPADHSHLSIGHAQRGYAPSSYGHAVYVPPAPAPYGHHSQQQQQQQAQQSHSRHHHLLAPDGGGAGPTTSQHHVH